MPNFPVVMLTPKPYAYITWTVDLPEIPEAMADGFATLSTSFAKAKATLAGPPMTHYSNFDTKSVTFDLGFPALPYEAAALRAAGLTVGQTPSGKAMTGVHMGPYDTTVASTYNEMTAAMAAKGLTGSKDMWETYFSPPGTPPEQIKTEITWPVLGAG